MARLQRLTLAEYVRRFVVPQFVQNHMLWLNGYDSEVVSVAQCASPKLFRVEFSDRTQTVTDHNSICFIQIVPGTLRNR